MATEKHNSDAQQGRERLRDALAADPFFDGDVHLDLSSCPLTKAELDAGKEPESFVDEQFQRPLDTGAYGVNLRKLIENPPDDILEELEKDAPNDPAVKAYRQRKLDDAEEKEAKAFLKVNPDYTPYDSNAEKLEAYLKEHGLAFTATNLTRAYKALIAENEIEFDELAVRPLSEAQKYDVIRLAQSGMTADALGRYLYFSLGQPDDLSPLDIINDPTYRDLCDAACWFVFTHSRVDYVPTPARKRFIAEYVAGRPLSLTILDSAWSACKQAEKTTGFANLLAPTPEHADAPSPQEIMADVEKLPDAELNSLLHRAKVERVKQLKVERGIA